MLTALVIVWLVSLPLVLPFAGYSMEAPMAWHPASLMASALVLRSRLLSAAICLLALGLLWIGSCFLPSAWARGAGMLFLAGAIPLPFFLVDVIRRDRTLKNVHYVFWNAASPLALQYERQVLSGPEQKIVPTVAFFIGPDDWSRIPPLAESDRNYLSQFHLGGGFYTARATNSFLHAFDSMGLHPFILNSENAAALQAFQRALQAGGEHGNQLQTMTTKPPVPGQADLSEADDFTAEDSELAIEDELSVMAESDEEHSVIEQILDPMHATAPKNNPSPAPARNEPMAPSPGAPAALKKITS